LRRQHFSVLRRLVRNTSSRSRPLRVAHYPHSDNDSGRMICRATASVARLLIGKRSACPYKDLNFPVSRFVRPKRRGPSVQTHDA
jgi:hypothetical protein